MFSDATANIELALINLAFAQAELALSDDPSGANRRSLEHIKAAILDLSPLAPRFGYPEVSAA
jgi:hypothetical protein